VGVLTKVAGAGVEAAVGSFEKSGFFVDESEAEEFEPDGV
jgi:hypothetical protein